MGSTDLKIYYIERYEIAAVGESVVQIQLFFSRRVLGIFLTTYMPTILLIIIVLGTHYFKPQYFPGAAQVVVTGTFFCKM